MKVLHSGTLAASYGGPAMSTYLTLMGLRDLGVDAQIIQQPLEKGDVMRGDDVPIHYYGKPWESKLCYTPNMKSAITSLGTFDIYHAQGIWRWHTYALVDAANKLERPYLITPRGMLYPQDIEKASKLFKKLSLRMRLKRDMNRAACVHVTCKEEMLHCRNLGIKSPIAVIPNPVEILDYPLTKQDNIFRFGYLGRVSRRKNIDGLIKAYTELSHLADGSELLVIGDGDKDYLNELHQLASRVKHGHVKFTGFLNGVEKDNALASCSVLVMPSEFENLGNVVLEGLVRRIPCIATTGAPWEELNTHHCGWQVPYTHESIKNSLMLALNTSENERKVMGENGRRLMEGRYSVEAVAKEMKSLYKWILTGNDKPSFVYEL